MRYLRDRFKSLLVGMAFAVVLVVVTALLCNVTGNGVYAVLRLLLCRVAYDPFTDWALAREKATPDDGVMF